MNNNDNINNNQSQTITNFTIIPGQSNDTNANVMQPVQPNQMVNNQSPAASNTNFTLGTTNNTSFANIIGNNINNEQNPSIVPVQPVEINTGQSSIPNNNYQNNSQQVVNVNTEQTSNINNVQSINNNVSTNMNGHDNSMLNNMNVDGTYNQMQAPDYVNDPTVKQNIEAKKKNTITITKELKTVIIIALVLLVFIIIMPILFDLINNVRFH